MAILQSCCCWRSVRKGSYASAVYTMGYYGVTVLIMSRFVYEERPYLQGNQTTPKSMSFLEPDSISPTTMGFNVVVLCFSSCGVLTSLLLVYGVYKDIRTLLVPWIVTVVLTMLVDLTHSIYLFAIVTIKFNPMTAILYTVDFFLLSLNMYSLLCVISQYQEYKAGRGTAADDFFGRVPPVRYANRPTATSCLSTRKAVTYHETRATPTQSPTAPHSTVLGDDSGVSQRSGSSRKHVQFPDTNMVTATAIDDEGGGEAGAGAVVVVMEEPWMKGAKTPRLLCPSVDLAPLINPEPPSILLHAVKQIK